MNVVNKVSHMVEKECCKRVLNDIWKLMESSGYRSLDDSEWEKLLDEASRLSWLYRERDQNTSLFFRDLVAGITDYYVQKNSPAAADNRDVHDVSETAVIDDRTAAFNLVQDIWRLTGNYEYKKLDGIFIDLFNKESDNIIKKYKNCSKEINNLCGSMIDSVRALYARIDSGAEVRPWTLQKKEKYNEMNCGFTITRIM